MNPVHLKSSTHLVISYFLGFLSPVIGPHIVNHLQDDQRLSPLSCHLLWYSGT
jgi:hypothetical protein